MARSRVLSFMSQWSAPNNSRSPTNTPPSPTSTQPLKQYSGPTAATAPTASTSTTPPGSTTQPDVPAQSSPSGRQRNRTNSRPSSRPASMVQTYQPPLMEVAQDTLPELQPIFTYLNSHSNKLYQEGYFLKLHDLDARGRPSGDRTWQECFAQLVGTVLSLWDAAELDGAGEDGEVVPSFINLADASMKMLESLPMNEGGQVLNNVLSISTAANNRYLFHFNSLNSLTQWTAGIRLALFEHTTLQEAYTGSLIAGKGRLLNNIRTIMDRTRFKYEDWARVRFGAGTPWRRCWFVVSPPDEKEYQKLQKQWKKKAQYEKMPLLKGDLKFYDSRKITKKSRPIATITDAWSAYAVYPQSKPLIDQSTLVKVEGRITIHSNPESSADGFVFVMPEVHPAVTGFEIMLRFLFPVWDTFALYGRPNKLIAETLDSRGLMFAMPKDRRYGYLEILDVSGLIHTEGSQNWTERRWRKEMKDLTSQRVATAADGPSMSRRSSSRQYTSARTSLLPARSNTIRFDGAGAGVISPTKGQEFIGATPPRTSFGSLSHRRSASEALGYRSSQKQTPSRPAEHNGGYESDSAPPRPPPHRTAYTAEALQASVGHEQYDTASEGRVSPEVDGSPPPNTNALPEMRALHPPEPVEPPPSFAHAPSSRPPTEPNQAPELRRGQSDLDQATLSQMAEATQLQNTRGGALQPAFGDSSYGNHGTQGTAGFAMMGVESFQRGLHQDNNQRTGMPLGAQVEGPLSGAPGVRPARLATIPASPYIPQLESEAFAPAAPRHVPANHEPARFPQHSEHLESPPSTSSSGSQYPRQALANTGFLPVQPDLNRSSSSFGVQRKPVPRTPSDQTPPPDAQTNLHEPASGSRSGDMAAADISLPSYLPDPSLERPRMGKKKTVGSVDLTKQDIVVGEAHYSNVQNPKPENDGLPSIDFGPTYRLDPAKPSGLPSGAASAGASPNASGPATPQSDSSAMAFPDNRSMSSLGNRPGHTPSSSQTRLPLRPAYAHQQTPPVESVSGKGLSTSGRTTPSGMGKASPTGPDREQQHVETMQRIEGLQSQIAGVELRPIEMETVQYDGQSLPRVVVFFLQQFRPKGPNISRDDPRERQERGRILAISKQVFQRYDEEQRHRRERAARQRAEMPPPGVGRPSSRQSHAQQQAYLDPRYVDQLQQQVRMNPRPQGVPTQAQQYGYGRPGTAPANNWAYGKAPNGGGPSVPPHQQSAYGEVNPHAGYTQEEAIRAGRFGPAS